MDPNVQGKQFDNPTHPLWHCPKNVMIQPAINPNVQHTIINGPHNSAKVKRQVPDRYLCHSCFKPGHFINDCPEAPPKTVGLTPYQGSKRCFGEYSCHKCNRKWVSGNSWSNSSQQCKTCKDFVYPFRQKPLELTQFSGGDFCPRKEHPRHLCEMCMKLGDYCRKNKNLGQ